jgi:hypothetical protein
LRSPYANNCTPIIRLLKKYLCGTVLIMPPKKWIATICVLTVFCAIVIIGKAKRCDTATEQCEATPAQVSSHDRTSVEKRSQEQLKAEEEKSRACNNAYSFFCKAVTPANLPNILLVIVGFVGIAVAVFTLFVLQEQAVATKSAAEATKKSVELQEIGFQQWIKATDWLAYIRERENGKTELFITCKIINPTNLPLTITHIDSGCRGIIYTSTERVTLTPDPDDYHLYGINTDLSKAELSEDSVSVTLRITLKFVNSIKREQSQTIVGMVSYNRVDEITVFTPLAWEAQQYEDMMNEEK